LESETDDERNTTMAEDRMAVLEMLRKLGADGDVDFLREGVRVLAAAVMEAEVTELTGGPRACGVPFFSHQAARSYSQSSLPGRSRRRTWLGDALAAKCADGLGGQ
jgi:hypothetical protein